MYRVAALAIVLALPVPVAAQRIPVPKPNPNFRWSDQGMGSRPIASNRPEPAAKDRITCLEEKASGKTVCHTRAEWQSIAQRLQSNSGR